MNKAKCNHFWCIIYEPYIHLFSQGYRLSGWEWCEECHEVREYKGE